MSQAMGSLEKRTCRQDPAKVALFLKHFNSSKHLFILMKRDSILIFIENMIKLIKRSVNKESEVSGEEDIGGFLWLLNGNGELIAPMTYRDTMTSRFLKLGFRNILPILTSVVYG